MLGRLNRPAPSVVVDREVAVSVLVTVTVALGTAAPDGSLTVPWTLAVPAVWACMMKEHKLRSSVAQTARGGAPLPDSPTDFSNRMGSVLGE